MVSPSNSDQAEYWSGPQGQSWITHQPEMDHLMSPVVDLLLERAGDVTGRDVLDIGCGAGAVSLAFAEAGARVTASDISMPLLSFADRRGNGLFETLLADAADAEWPKQFDLAVSRFGVMFFADPERAFANIGRALRPGGKMLFAAWGPFAENVWWQVPQDITARRMGVTLSPSDPHAPGPMGLSDMDWTLDHFRAAGMERVQGEFVDIAMPGGTPDEAGRLATQLGPGARVLRLNEASEADRKAVAIDIAHAMRDYETDGQVAIPARVCLYTAFAP